MATELAPIGILEQMAITAMAELPAARSGADLLLLGPPPVGGPEEPEGVQTHVPAFPELLLVRQGRLSLATPAGRVTVGPGQVLAIAPGARHGEIWEGEYDAVFLVIQKAAVRFYRRVSHPREIVSIYLLGRTDLSYIAEGLLQELSERLIGYEASVHGLLEHLHSLLLRRLLRGSFLHQPWATGSGDADTHSRLVVQRTLEYLTAHFREPISAEEVARQMLYSLAHLNRFTRRFLGKSVSECLRDLRMTHARDLLRNSGLSVAEIADRVGYSDPSNFRRAFRAFVGVGPKQYRSGRRTPAAGRGASGRAGKNGRAGRRRARGEVTRTTGPDGSVAPNALVPPGLSPQGAPPTNAAGRPGASGGR